MKCWHCGGSGTVHQFDPDTWARDGFLTTFPVPCNECKGDGKVSFRKWLSNTWEFRIWLPLYVWYDLNFNDDADSEGY